MNRAMADVLAMCAFSMATALGCGSTDDHAPTAMCVGTACAPPANEAPGGRGNVGGSSVDSQNSGAPEPNGGAAPGPGSAGGTPGAQNAGGGTTTGSPTTGAGGLGTTPVTPGGPGSSTTPTSPGGATGDAGTTGTTDAGVNATDAGISIVVQ
jgi:hypothetical protein